MPLEYGSSELEATMTNQVHVKKIHIEHFRAIENVELTFNETTAVVGQNSAGKTSILRALNCFFNYEDEKGAFENGEHAFTSKHTSRIAVGLSGIPEKNGKVKDELSWYRLTYKINPRWYKWDSSKKTWVPNSDVPAEVSRYFNFVLIPIRRDHEVAHDPRRGILALPVLECVDPG